MNKNNIFAVLCMFVGMIFGTAIGYIVGISQGNIGTYMCYGLVFGMVLGICIGTIIKKFKDRE